MKKGEKIFTVIIFLILIFFVAIFCYYSLIQDLEKADYWTNALCLEEKGELIERTFLLDICIIDGEKYIADFVMVNYETIYNKSEWNPNIEYNKEWRLVKNER